MAAATETSISSASDSRPNPEADFEKGDETSPTHNVKQNPTPEPVEGGTQAWLSLLGASCAMFVSFGWVNCIALFQAEYERNQLRQYNKSTVSWITSMECKFTFTDIITYLRCIETHTFSPGSLFHALHVALVGLVI